MRRSLTPLSRFLATTTVSKHRLFVWLESPTLPDHQLIVFARSEGSFFGVLHSRIHEVWARAQGTQVREVESGPRYTPTTCFETFPLPEPTTEQEAAIAAAAKELDELRSGWLNPPEWTKTEVLEFPGSTDGPWARYIDPATVQDRRIHCPSHPTWPRLPRAPAALTLTLSQRRGDPGCGTGALAADRAQGPRLRGEPQEADAHEPLQRAPGLARPGPQAARRSGLRRLRLGPGHRR